MRLQWSPDPIDCWETLAPVDCWRPLLLEIAWTPLLLEIAVSFMLMEITGDPYSLRFVVDLQHEC